MMHIKCSLWNALCLVSVAVVYVSMKMCYWYYWGKIRSRVILWYITITWKLLGIVTGGKAFRLKVLVISKGSSKRMSWESAKNCNIQ